jgi:hypothetical protein
MMRSYARWLACMASVAWLTLPLAANAGVIYVIGAGAAPRTHDSRVVTGVQVSASVRSELAPALPEAGFEGAPGDGARARGTVLMGAGLAPGNAVRTPTNGPRQSLCSECSYGAVEPIIRATSAIARVDPALVAAVIDVESGFNRHALSPAGAQGLMQLMPGTALRFGVSDVSDPVQNIAAGTLYLGRLIQQFSGNLRYALAAYNAGEANVRSYGGIPPFAETQDYVVRVLARYDAFRSRSAR